MSGHFEVSDWESLQHYKKRSPPWIKLYNSILEDFSFASLQDYQKYQLIGLYLLASRTGNKIPNNPEWAQRKIESEYPLDFQLFVDRGFLAFVQEDKGLLAGRYQDASGMLAERNQSESNSLERAEQSRKKEKSQPGADLKIFTLPEASNDL